ncbi:hypothetical protein [Pseudomonas sp. TMP9]|uniref:hypothetical protein n=1 Tax=Pseudomonas sp. TMP9 TaxID=3133144 RepID=UPI0030CFDF48
MNAFRRAYLVLLLSLILPLQSVAGMLEAGEICLMDHVSQMQMECCDDAAMAAAAGSQACPDMLKCSSVSLPLLNAQRLKLKALPNERGPLWLTQSVFPSRPQAAPWRPPRA